MAEVLTINRQRLTFHNLRVYPLIYLASPYTLYSAGIQKAFEDAAKLTGRLIRNGIRVYSPIVHSHPAAIYGDLNPLDHSIWIPFNEAMTRVCNALVVAEMEGWKESKGTGIEIRIFENDEKPIYYIDPNSLLIRT